VVGGQAVAVITFTGTQIVNCSRPNGDYTLTVPCESRPRRRWAGAGGRLYDHLFPPLKTILKDFLKKALDAGTWSCTFWDA
jgi:hypothetical protein